jgi:hypothetical protein
MKMTFHFARVPDSDVSVEGTDIGQCTLKAFEIRMREVTPSKIQGEITE